MSSLRHEFPNRVSSYLKHFGFRGLVWQQSKPTAQEAKDVIMTTKENSSHDAPDTLRGKEPDDRNNASVKPSRTPASKDDLLFDFFDRNLKSEDYRNMIHKVEKDAK